jgi:hypothetical protein
MTRLDWDTQAVVLPIGIRPKKWLTPLTVDDCRHQVEERSSAFLGMQVYDSGSHKGNSAIRLRVRFRPWWRLHQAGEVVVDLEPEDGTSKTEVRVAAGLRMGVVISLLVWTAVLFIPVLIFGPLPTKIFFGVVLVIPPIFAFLNARTQIRSAIHRLHAALPDA